MGEVSEVFKLFDVNGEGTIKQKEVATVLRSLGFAPPESVLNEMLAEAKKADQYNRGTVSEDMFVRFAAKAKEYSRATEGDAAKELDAFKDGILHFCDGVSVKDIQDGKAPTTINLKEVTRCMEKLGEKMMDREIEEFVAEVRKVCKVEGDRVDFEDFKKMLLVGFA